MDPDAYADRVLGSAGTTAPQSAMGDTDPDAFADRVLEVNIPAAEYASRAQRAGLSVGRSAEEHAKILSERGLAPKEVQRLTQNYRLDLEYSKLGRFAGGKETVVGSVAKQAKENFIPFRSWFVSPQKDEAGAQARFEQGVATDEDIRTLALARRRGEDEANLRETIGGEIVGALRSAPALIGEFMVGGAVAGRILGKAGALGDSLGRHAVRMGLITPFVPSMYMDAARQKNVENGREPDDWRGLPPAVMHSYATMLVLGRVLRGSAEGARPATGVLAGTRASASAGARGAVELGIADAATQFADLFLPKAYKISSGDGLIGHLLQGDVSRAARKFAVDAVTLAAFAGMHRMADGLGVEPAAERAAKILETLKDMEPDKLIRLKEWVKSANDPESGRKLNDYFERLRKGGPELEFPFFPPESGRPMPEEGLPRELWDREKVSSEKPFFPERSQPAGEIAEFPPESGVAPPFTPKKVKAKPNVSEAEPQFAGEPSRKIAGTQPGEPPLSETSTAPPSSPGLRLASEAAKPTVGPSTEPIVESGATGSVKLTKGQTKFLKGEIRPGISPQIEKIVDALDLAPEEALVIKGMLAGFAPSGAKMAAGIGYSRETANTLSAKALEKVRQQMPLLAEQIERIQNREVGRRGTGGVQFMRSGPPDLMEAAEAALAEGVTPNYTPLLEAIRSKIGREVTPAEMEQILGPVAPRLKADLDNAYISDVQKVSYGDTVGVVTGRMPDVARARMAFHLKESRWFGTPEDSMTSAVLHVAEQYPNDPYWRAELDKQMDNPEAGAGVSQDGVLHIDGGLGVGYKPHEGRYAGESTTAEGIQAHEYAHLVDGPPRNAKGEPDPAGSRELSDTPEFDRAWRKEILDKDAGGEYRLTDYATQSRSEGFAEFMRLLWGTDVPTAQIAKDFPETSRWAKKNGLWPEDRGGAETAGKLTEVFDRRVAKTPQSFEHVDVLTPGESKNLLSQMRAPKLEEIKGFLWRAKEWMGRVVGDRSAAPPPVVLDDTHLLPRPQASSEYKQIVSEQQGVGRVPVAKWLFDPGRSDVTPEGQSLVAYRALSETGVDVAVHWAASDKVSDALFGADLVTGKYRRGDGTEGFKSDDIEAEMRSPGSVPGMSDAQRAWVRDTWTPLFRDAVAMLKGEGVQSWVNEDGTRISLDMKAYFPRPAIGKKGMEGTELGSSRGERLYETEEVGSEAGIVYDPSAKSAVSKFIAGAYKRIAAHRLATDPALRGRTVGQRFEDFKAANKDRLDTLDAAGKTDLLKELEERAAYPVWGKESKLENLGPMFHGKIFPKEIADKIENVFRQESSDWLKRVEKVSAAAKGVALGGDASWLFIQLLPTMFRNPLVWARSVKAGVQAVFDPKKLSALMDRPEMAQGARELVQLGSSVGRLQDFMTGLSTGELATKIPVLGKVYEAAGRGFGVALDVAKIELWNKWKPLAKPSEYRALAESIDSMLMSGRMESIGLSPRRAMAERIFLLAPSYYRGGANLIATAFQRGLPGDLARQALGATMAGVALTAVAAMKAVGLSDDEVEERLNPARGKFLKVPVDLGDNQKLEVGYGNILTSYARLAGAAADHFGSDKPIDTGADGNPMLRWLRGKAAFSPRLAIDIWTGKDYFGVRQQPQEAVLRAFEPLALQQLLHGDQAAFEKGAFDPQQPGRVTVADAVTSLLGLSSYAGTGGERRLAVYDEESRRLHGKPYGELTLQQQAAAVKAAKARPDFPKVDPPTADEMERAFAAKAERASKILGALSDGSRKKLESLGEEVPSPNGAIRVNGEDVPLSATRMRSYLNLLAVEYDRAVDKFDVGNLKSMGAEARKKWIDNQFRIAGMRAKQHFVSESQKK